MVLAGLKKICLFAIP